MSCTPVAGAAALSPLIEKTFPLERRFRQALPADVAELSRLLTSARPERDNGYLGRPRLLNAYLRYFLPWNVFRLCSIFSLPGSSDRILPLLQDGDAVTDLGSGPLTFPIALWLAFPELRKRRLEFRCIDHSGGILEAGKKLFIALTEQIPGPEETVKPAWTIKTIRGALDTLIYGSKAKLVTAINVFNELYQRGPGGEGAARAALLLTKLCTGDGAVLVVEPGNPRGGAFIAALRGTLLEGGRTPAAPCPHSAVCPLAGTGRRQNGGKAKWCHFAFNTEGAPPELHRLSEAAGLPKERATASFLLTEPQTEELRRIRVNQTPYDLKRIHVTAAPSGIMRMRVISDAFPVTGNGIGQWGRYGCSEQGLVLFAGDRSSVEAAELGALLELPAGKTGQRDKKTGAAIVTTLRRGESLTP